MSLSEYFFCGPQIMTVHPSSKLRQHEFSAVHCWSAQNFLQQAGHSIGWARKLEVGNGMMVWRMAAWEWKQVGFETSVSFFPTHEILSTTSLESLIPPLFPSRLPVRLHDPLHLLPAMSSNESRRVVMAIGISQKACRERLMKSRVEVTAFSS